MSLPASGDALYDAALEPLGKYLGRKNLVEFVANRPGEAGLLLLKQTKAGKVEEWAWEKAPELNLSYWSKLCHILANKKGHHFDEVAQPRVSTQLPGGHRFEAMMGKVVDDGIGVAIRMKRRAGASLDDFGLTGALLHQVQVAVAAGANVLIAGGTSTGKTTFLNLLLELIPLDRRLFVMEDTKELEVPHHNLTRRLISRNETGCAVGYAEVFDHAMRMRPDQVLLGELSIPNTYPALRLLNTGHRGFFATIHADSPELALGEAFYQNLALGGHGELSPDYVREYLHRTVDLVVQLGHPEGASRRVTALWWRGELQEVEAGKGRAAA